MYACGIISLMMMMMIINWKYPGIEFHRYYLSGFFFGLVCSSIRSLVCSVVVVLSKQKKKERKKVRKAEPFQCIIPLMEKIYRYEEYLQIFFFFAVVVETFSGRWRRRRGQKVKVWNLLHREYHWKSAIVTS